MPLKLPCCFPLLFFLLCFSFFVDSNELDSLLTLKSFLEKSNPKLFASWVSSKPICTFRGISCNSNNSVIEVDLSRQGLSGTLPLSSLCSLPYLQKLAFGFNSLTGKITPDIKNCTSLKYLDLGNNKFTGSVPDISPLSQIKYLYLNSSGFSGNFPWKSLSNMSDLVQLSIGDNSFETSPFPKHITKLENLNVLYLTSCGISGVIPSDIGNLTKLFDLELSFNFLSGPIPQEISKLNQLTHLQLHDNRLTGKLPVGFGNLQKLQQFDASNNSLEGDISELKSLNQLVWLQLFDNNFSGEIPEEFGDFKNLVNLSLYNNNLTGELPEKIGSWADFDFIDVSTNSLSGSIPPDMCKKGTMTKLLMLENKFSGKIPASYANCSSLTRFRVNENSLTGSVPDGIWGLPNMNIIDIADNQLDGYISPEIGKAKSLGQIYASNNKLSGNLPKEISGASMLDSISLSGNQLTGEIPESIGDLKHLSSLNLDGNLFSGKIPDSFGENVRLSVLNLAHNSLSGEIPISLGDLHTMDSLNLSHNELSGLIPKTLSSLTVSLLDLSYNELSGPIPDSFTIGAYSESFVGNTGLCSSKAEHFLPCSASSQGNRTLVIWLVVGLVIVVVSSGVYLYMKLGATRKDKNRTFSLKDDYSWNMKSYHVLTFTEEEVLDAIQPQNLIGKGGCGSVYKVNLRDGKKLAVKHISNFEISHDQNKIKPSTPMLNKQGGRSRKSKEFDMEVQTLSSIRHINVVKLYCSITSEDSSSSLLVYEYLPNGSLWDRLHGSMKQALDWQIRYEIALGAARGLEYLHHGYERPVIHRDVKSSNILLDEFLKPRIADFGLAKIVQGNDVQDFTNVIAGTLGYIAPEYGYTYKVNEKIDVYSFGVVLMELVTGRKPIELEFGESKDIVSWVSNKLGNKDSVMNYLVDSNIHESLKDKAIKVLQIGILCTNRVPELRPTMRIVVQMLEGAQSCKLECAIDEKDDPQKMNGVTVEV